MNRVPVASSSIKSVGHENGALEVEFKNGSVYRYDGVTADDHQHLLDAESVGKHFAAHVRGKFPHSKVA